ncbi:hypothetical protein [Stutzerimonas nitrititolerans]|uniref:hypothetical protein n=1 Tax=Stutzerimonas nitrititolerans TaxID=2482751 RepID=UPI00289954B1|nr:hypothetical protein [Stutzerimonas nitrititolerans]
MIASTPLPYLASQHQQRYGSPVTVNPVAGFGDLNLKLAHVRPKTIAGAFFVSAMPLYGGRARETERSAGCQLARFANPRTAATHNRLATIRGSSATQVGAPPMQTTRNPSTHAAAWKARAFAALRADSSLSVRLRRYNEAMARARSLETVGGVQ